MNRIERAAVRKLIEYRMELMKLTGHVFDEAAKKTYCHKCGLSAAKIDPLSVEPCIMWHAVTTSYRGEEAFVRCATCDERPEAEDDASVARFAVTQCPGRPVPVARKP